MLWFAKDIQQLRDLHFNILFLLWKEPTQLIPFEHNFSFESTSHLLVDTLDRVELLVFLAATVTVPSTTGPNATFAPANNKESNTMYNCNKHKRQ